MKYGDLPKEVGIIEATTNEMFFYQDMPIKMAGRDLVKTEPRLDFLREIIIRSVNDFVIEFGEAQYRKSYIYLCAKNLWQNKGVSYNRMGYHSDGFMSDDINYVWSDKDGTVFNNSDFIITKDDILSLYEMNSQALPEREIVYSDKTLLRLNQYNIHKVSDVNESGVRLFVKITFSKDKFDLIGNSHNYEFDYNWEMKPRNISRNIPQSIKSN